MKLQTRPICVSSQFITYLGLSLLFLAGCSVDDDFNEAEYLKKAESFYKAGDLRSSMIELKNVLKHNPKNANARYMLALNYIEAGNGKTAEKEISRAIDLGYNRQSALPVLLRTLLLQRRYADVKKKLDLGDAELQNELELLVMRAGQSV